jgi:NADH-quinone oxidoreductase subunit J
MSPLLQNFMSAQVLLFLVFGLGALLCAVTMVLNPNPVRSALFLVLNLFCVAVMYLLLNAYFLAAVQIIVYTGAIMVLFLFVIMLLNLGTPDRQKDRLQWQQPVAIGAGIVLTALFSLTIYSSVPAVPVFKKVDPTRGMATMSAATTGNLAAGPGATGTADASAGAGGPGESAAGAAAPSLAIADPQTMGSVESIGRTLYSDKQPWLFPFEVTSILLLVAVIGAVVLAGRRRPGEEIVPSLVASSSVPAEPANPYAMEEDDE